MSSAHAGKVALVTGCARGLGLQLAQDLGASGAKISGCDIRADLLATAMARISQEHGVETMATPVDLKEETQIIGWVRQTVEKFGQIDYLINNAGVRETAPVWETDTAMWDRIQAVNLRAQYLCVREVLNAGMLQRNCGAIVNISSGSGKFGQQQCSAYCASKWGILGFTESIAKDLKETRIRVTAVTPGMIATPMLMEVAPQCDWFHPREVSQAILSYLAQGPDTVIPEIRIYHRNQL